MFLNYVSSDFTYVHTLTPHTIQVGSNSDDSQFHTGVHDEAKGDRCLTIWPEDEAGDGGDVVLCVGIALAPWFC